jgi:cell division protease FtsH
MSKKKPNNKTRRKIIINLAYLISIILIFVLLITINPKEIDQNDDKQGSFSSLITEIRNQNVSKIIETEGEKTLTVETYNDTARKDRDNVSTENYTKINAGTSTSIIELINESLGEDKSITIGNDNGQIIYELKPKPFLKTLLDNGLFQFLIQFAIFAAIALFIIRKLSDVNSRSMSFGNSRAKAYDEIDTKDKVTFEDVAGNQEAKQELTEIVDFLKRPEEYVKMGAKIPRGALLVGAPGNGKTLMAKAIAGEANVPFFFVSGSEFVEMFVGVGAGRVRDLFRRAKKKAPCVIFIDEIDAVGRQRGAGLGGGNDEREQTLNQILVEMDGFEANTSVIVIGATNRPDVLDPALLRPGRFDRQITVTSPDRQEREKILQVHVKNKKLAKSVNLDIIAKRTAGFSGADLANVLNEAAILTVREKKKEIDDEALREAVEKVVLGPSLKTKVITEDQKKLTAYHEAGHALVSTVIPGANRVQKITIIPRGKAGGYTFSDQGDNDPITRKFSQFMADIAVLFGGYTVEKLIFGEVSTGASNDLAKATEIARNMVTRYGMSGLGPISFDESKGLSFLGKDMVEGKQYSEESAKTIDMEIQKILTEGFKTCQKIITTHKKELQKIAETLIEKEVLEFEEFNAITKHINPNFSSEA